MRLDQPLDGVHLGDVQSLAFAEDTLYILTTGSLVAMDLEGRLEKIFATGTELVLDDETVRRLAMPNAPSAAIAPGRHGELLLVLPWRHELIALSTR